MACLLTSTGSTVKAARPRWPEPPPAGGARSALRLAAAAALALAAASGAVGQEAPLPPERAFSFSARALDPATVEARFAVAPGYYLYRDKMRFALAPGALAAPPVLPPGKVKDDEFFGRVETYREELVVRLALAAPAPGATITVTAESQGCADIGICYPPQQQKITLSLPAAGAGPGAPVEAVPPRKGWFK